ncbi:MAG: tetratricopeptide repeat protein, partial [Anaerolineales bacterium]|nr:tetratricopeptide repeat protein [Anaerolineales bacterium]
MTQSLDNKQVITRKTIRQALKAWPNSAALGGLPLANARSVARQRAQAGYEDNPAGRGIALRHLLQKAIEQLKPDADANEAPSFEEPQWRLYHIMQEQILQNRRAQDIREEMGVSESGYFNDQRRALDGLVAAFKEWELVPTTAESGPHPLITLPVAETAVSNLPHPSTTFIGRQEERQRIAHLLQQADCRLISIIGPGGMGKTRLAIQAATEQGHTAYFVQLEAIDTAELIVPTIAQTVHFAVDSQEDALPQLVNFLRPKHWLLVLDNFEHLTQAGIAVINTLLNQTPHLKLLVTSRERLNVRGEWIIDLHGLDVPETNTADPQSYSAVCLFLNALERVRAGETAAPDELPAVVQICQLVQGMPLGLELAASWGSMLSCTEIASEIKNSLDFLAAAYRDLPARHQSLRAVFDHSWLLLNEQEQAAFRKLAVFRGGFDRTAAKEVAEAHLPLLHALTSKSLLRLTSNGRYSVHPLLRQFAREKLQEQTNDWTEAHAKHGRYFVRFMRTHVEALKKGGHQQEALEQAERELENVRLAWRWALTEQQDEMLLTAAEAIYHFFAMTNRAREGEETVRGVVAHLQARPLAHLTPLQKRLLGFAQGIQARFLYIMGRQKEAQQLFQEALTLLRTYGEAAATALISMFAIPANLKTPTFRPQELYEESLAYFEHSDDKWGIATTYVRYVDHVRSTNTTDDDGIQRELMETCLRLRQQIGDQRGVANCLNYLCDLAYSRGDYEEAHERAAQSLAIHQTLGNQIGRAHSLNHLGQVAGSLGAYSEAQGYYQESLSLLRSYGNPRETADALDCVGYVTYLMGEYEAAAPYYQESLQISREIEDTHGEAWSLHNLGDIARARGLYQRAKQ